MGLEAIIPHMTNNNTPTPFVASTSNQLATYAPFNAFQDNGGGWISDVANSYIQIDLGRPYKVSKVYIDTVSSWTGAHMNTLTLMASNDGTNWTILYTGATTSYKYIAEKEFGIYRYWRIKAGSMTMRGGCVRYFQLYGDPAGFVDLDVNNIWVTEEPTVLKGTVYALIEPVDVRVLVNGVVEDDWHTFSGKVPVEYEYDPSLFNEGGNIVTVQNKDLSGKITENVFVLYKLNLEAYKFNTSSYDFKIKNSPLRPSTDMWISQNYMMDYLNSELGVSYIFRFKPYAQIESRIEGSPRLFDRILKDNYNIEQDQLLATRKSGRKGIKQESKRAQTEEFLSSIKSGQFQTAFKEIGIIQRVFDSWAAMNTENIGINPDANNLAVKKIKVSQDILQLHSLNGRRKEMIQNALTLIQGYELGSKKTFDTVVDYYRAMEEFYPYKETILGGLLLNAISEEMKASKYPDISIGWKQLQETVVVSTNPLGEQYENLTWVSLYMNADIKTPIEDAFINGVQLGSKTDKTNIHVADQLLVASKTNFYGITSTNSFAETGGGEGTSYSIGFATTQNDEGRFDSTSLATTQGDEATSYDVLMSTKDQNKEMYNIGVTGAHKDNGTREVHLIKPFLIDKSQSSKEFMINDVEFISKMDSDALIESVRDFTELMPVEATNKGMVSFLNKMEADSNDLYSTIGLNKMESDAMLEDITDTFVDLMPHSSLTYGDLLLYVDKMNKASQFDTSIIVFDKLNKTSWDIGTQILKFEKLFKDFRVDTAVLFTNKTDSKQGRPIFDDAFFDKVDRDTYVHIMESFTDMVPKDVYNSGDDISYVDKASHLMMHDDSLRMIDKIEKKAFILTVMANINALEKASIIHANWEFASKIIESAKAIDDAARFADKEEKFSYLYEDNLAYIEEKKAIIIEQLLLDHVNLNGYIMDLMNVDTERELPQSALKMQEILSDKEVAIGFIQEGIDANRTNQEKEGYIPENTFVLAGDGSEWDEIWNRYSPGVDILDPPDSDFDYSKLAPAIYDVATGVPKNPIGKSNLPDVYVQTSLSHPIPDNDTVGVDDTKRIAVDNYIFIDTVLALESIKNRQKLRYAGMPVGKTIKEVFSQLYTWIQQAAPGHKEYERMFRFSRWYAEAVVLRNSKQILHRVYNPWQSSLHMGSGLGIDHVKHGWSYMTGTGTLDTTTLSAHLIFSKESYIDSEFVLRGYFDNPAGKGTMEISVDGVVVDSFSTHGVYERRIEILQGYHTYDIFFYGTSGAAVISSIEIGGTNFVSAHTTSDDSDVNGLKALTELMAQLLGYFELHHGGRKIKGTMEVRQRAVWNTHT